jgi:hypothetical protein
MCSATQLAFSSARFSWQDGQKQRPRQEYDSGQFFQRGFLVSATWFLSTFHIRRSRVGLKPEEKRLDSANWPHSVSFMALSADTGNRKGRRQRELQEIEFPPDLFQVDHPTVRAPPFRQCPLPPNFTE